MKKQMKWLLAALALAALATPAFAVTADMTGTLGVRALATNNFDGNSDAKDRGAFVDQRFRLFTSVAANENVKAVLGLEVDNVWGGGSAPSATAVATKDVGRMGADSTTQVEIKHLYLDFKIPALGANVKAGTQPFNFGRGLIINDDAAGLAISLPCKINPNNKIDLTWIKTAEAVNNAAGGVNATQKDDGDFYGAKYSLKVADISIAPYVGYYKVGKSAVSAADTNAGFFGVDVDGKAGAIGYALTAIYNDWSRGAADGSSISLLAKGTMAMGDTTLSLEAGRYGDKDNGGNSISLAQSTTTGPINNVSEITTGGQYTSNSALNANAGGAATLYTTNFLYAKIGAVQKLNDTMKVSGYLAHIQQAADSGPLPAQDAKTIGQEVDAYFDYTIVPGLGLNVVAAYLLADEDFGKGDNAWKLGTSLNYKF